MCICHQHDICIELRSQSEELLQISESNIKYFLVSKKEIRSVKSLLKYS